MKLYKTYLEKCSNFIDYISMLFSGDYEEINVDTNIYKVAEEDYEELITNKLDKIVNVSDEHFTGMMRIENKAEFKRYCYAEFVDGKLNTICFDEDQLENKEFLMYLEEEKIDAIQWDVAKSLEMEFFKDNLLHPFKFSGLEQSYYSNEIGSYKDVQTFFEDEEKAKYMFKMLSVFEEQAFDNLELDEVIYDAVLNYDEQENNDLEVEEGLER